MQGGTVRGSQARGGSLQGQKGVPGTALVLRGHQTDMGTAPGPPARRIQQGIPLDLELQRDNPLDQRIQRDNLLGQRAGWGLRGPSRATPG